jgi:hypothetical protein
MRPINLLTVCDPAYTGGREAKFREASAIAARIAENLKME